MTKLKTTAPAKINLTLDVLDRRPDGYHNLATIMHQIPLEDEIEVVMGESGGIRAVTNYSYIRNDTNIAAKAAKLFLDELGKEVMITEKHANILIEIKNKITPPPIPSDTCVTCSKFRIRPPNSRNTSRITSAIADSRKMIRR